MWMLRLAFARNSTLHWQSASHWMKWSPGRGLHLLEPGVLPDCLRWQWGAFMVYMQTPEAVLFPKPKKPQVAEQQNAARRARQVTIINVIQNIGSVQGGVVYGVSAGSIGAEANAGKADGNDQETVG